MSFQSILFDGDSQGDLSASEPPFFGDLRLDQVLVAMTIGREEYELAPLFYRPLRDVEAVRYRHHVFRDLERPETRAAVDRFADAMRRVRECHVLVGKLHYPLQGQRWFLEGIRTYCGAAKALSKELDGLELESSGLVAFRAYVHEYVGGDEFVGIDNESREVTDHLAEVRYAVHIKGNRVRVNHFEGEPDMSEEVEQTFAKFKQGAVKDHRVRLRNHLDMNHVEAQILGLVAQLYPDTFTALADCCARHADYIDSTLARFDREIQFYLGYIDYADRLRASGLSYSYPRVSARSKEEHVADTFDLALATKLLQERGSVVCNDFHLTEPERILVISGPNNGGKTTFARLYGQLHYLASLGVPVPGRDARLYLPDQIFTHFEREEDIETLRGKFEDELVRIREILGSATSKSILVMNESFGSTTLNDALIVGTRVLKQVIELDALCVFVTFVDELASLGTTTVSMMSTVVPEDPAVRTFKVVRKPADGLAYATAIAEKYGLSYDALRGRIAR